MGKDNFVSDQESSSMGEAAFEPKFESWSSWFCRHGLQIAKGGVAVAGLLALGVGLGYWFGRRSGAGSNTSSPGNALVESTSALVSNVSPSPMSLVLASEFHDTENLAEADYLVPTATQEKTSTLDLTCTLGMIVGGASGNPLLFTAGILNCFEPVEALLKLISAIPAQSFQRGQSISVSFNLSTIFQDTNDPGGEYLEVAVTPMDGGKFPLWMNCSCGNSYSIWQTGQWIASAYDYRSVLDITDIVDNKLYAVVTRGIYPSTTLLITLDVSKPNPDKVAELDLGGGGSRAILDTAASKIYLNGRELFLVADVNKTLPVILKPSLSTPMQFYKDFVLSDHIVYLAGAYGSYKPASWTKYFSILDVRNPLQPYFVGKYQSPSSSDPITFDSISVSGNGKAYLSEGKLLHVMDTTNLTQPRLLASYTADAVSARIVARGDILYLPAGSAVQIVNMTNPVDPLAKYDAPDAIRGLLLEGNQLWLLTHSHRGSTYAVCLELLDVSDIRNPILLRQWNGENWELLDNSDATIVKHRNRIFAAYDYQGYGKIRALQLQRSKIASFSRCTNSNRWRQYTNKINCN